MNFEITQYVLPLSKSISMEYGAFESGSDNAGAEFARIPEHSSMNNVRPDMIETKTFLIFENFS